MTFNIFSRQKKTYRDGETRFRWDPGRGEANQTGRSGDPHALTNPGNTVRHDGCFTPSPCGFATPSCLAKLQKPNSHPEALSYSYPSGLTAAGAPHPHHNCCEGDGGREGGGSAAAAGARGFERAWRRSRGRSDVGADARQRRGLHRRHGCARPSLRLPRRRLGRGIHRRRRRRLRHALLHASPSQYRSLRTTLPSSPHPTLLDGRFSPLMMMLLLSCLT